MAGGTLVSAIPATLEAGIGAAQYFAGRNQAKRNDRPEMPIPEYATDALGNAVNLGSSFNFAGQQEQEQLLDQTLANTTSNITEYADNPASALAAAVQAGATRQQSQVGIAGTAAQDYFRRQEAVRGELNNMANWEQKTWEWNEQQKFQENAAAASALQEAGISNFFDAVNTGAGIGANALGTKSASMATTLNTPNTKSASGDIDPETMDKITKVIQSMNKSTPENTSAMIEDILKSKFDKPINTLSK